MDAMAEANVGGVHYWFALLLKFKVHIYGRASRRLQANAKYLPGFNLYSWY